MRSALGSTAGPIGAASSERDAAPLAGRTVLLVEDEAMVALELEFALEDAGATVIGPVAHLRDAVDAARKGADKGVDERDGRAREGAAIDVALLDVDLNGEAVFPAADLLLAGDVPFAFHTGHGDRADLARAYPGAPVCIKPMTSERIVAVLAKLL